MKFAQVVSVGDKSQKLRVPAAAVGGDIETTINRIRKLPRWSCEIEHVAAVAVKSMSSK